MCSLQYTLSQHSKNAKYKLDIIMMQPMADVIMCLIIEVTGNVCLVCTDVICVGYIKNIKLNKIGFLLFTSF